MTSSFYRSLRGYKYMVTVPQATHTGIAPPYGTAIVTPFLSLDPGGWLTAKVGYAWDGVTLGPDLPSLMHASLFHDALYQLIRDGRLPVDSKDAADIVLKSVALQHGASPWVANSIWWTVHRFGDRFCKPRKASEP